MPKASWLTVKRLLEPAASIFVARLPDLIGLDGSALSRVHYSSRQGFPFPFLDYILGMSDTGPIVMLEGMSSVPLIHHFY